MSDPQVLSTRQVAQRVSRGSLPESSPGKACCACHPNDPREEAQTETLRFWSKGDKISCIETRKWAPALPFFPQLNIFIDTRL